MGQSYFSSRPGSVAAAQAPVRTVCENVTESVQCHDGCRVSLGRPFRPGQRALKLAVTQTGADAVSKRSQDIFGGQLCLLLR